MTPSPRFLNDETLPTIEENLALDEALLDQAEDLDLAPVLRFWESPAVAVVLGASSRLHRDVHVASCRADGIPIARRSSGGGTVVIGPGVLCVAVVLPIAAHPALAAVDTAQRHVLEAAAAALRTPDTPVQVRGHGDLTIDERKISGSAQRRLRHHVLVHFTVLCGLPLALIPRYLATPDRQPAYRQGRPHDAFLASYPAPTRQAQTRLLNAWSEGPPLHPISAPRSRIDSVLADKMLREGWVERF